MADHFNNAKKVVLTHFNSLIQFCNELERSNPGVGFKDHAVTLTALKDKLDSAAANPALDSADLARLENIRQHLINHPTWRPKLVTYSQLTEVVAKAVIIDRSINVDANKLRDDLPRLSGIADVTNDVIKELKTDPYSVRSLLAMMLVFLSRKEAFMHSTSSVIDQVVKELHLEQQYDLKELFSMQGKVQRNTKYETDIDAVRTCIAHGRYKVEKRVGGDLIVHFENRIDGWDFVKDYTNKEFYRFFSDYYLFERLLSILHGIDYNKVMIRYYLM